MPRRASLRQRGVAADGSMIDEERRNGELVIINGERIRLAPGQAIEDLPPRERHPAGPHRFATHHHQPEGRTYTVEAPLPPTPRSDELSCLCAHSYCQTDHKRTRATTQSTTTTPRQPV